MRVMAQLAMVMNLDKCIGCHTCSVTCKQAWTNRTGVEYVWFNNVETRPGQGYPRRYEDQDAWRGGWTINRRGRLALKGGGRFKKLLTIFANPKLPSIQDYYEPWTYDYETLTNAPLQEHTPVARPKSLISGQHMKISWSANWDDDLGGAPDHGNQDVLLKAISDKVRFEFEKTFMFYLPRICEHCLNPSCAASCPSGAIYKRTEDGIVLVDQDRCRGWRMCVSGCPYKKVYFNHRTGKAEKCTFCFPRTEVGIPTVCSETCVGRLRYIGLMLYDADRVLQAAATVDEHGLYEAQRQVFLDPDDPGVTAAAERAGIPRDWIDAAQRSPVHALINTYRVALPLHPEYRTMPMVWYIPPLSPVVDVVRDTGYDAEDRGNLFAAIEALRIPVDYLAQLFTAGDPVPVEAVLRKLAAMRSYLRDINLGRDPDDAIPAAVGMTGEQVYDMYRLLALAKYDERYVIPPAHAEQAHGLEELATECSLDYEWTTRSSQLYERRLLRLGSPLFHFGILLVALGHIGGLLLPESWTEAVGVSETAYHAVAVGLGTIAGFCTLTGAAILIYRRRTVGPVFSATTRNDKAMYVLLIGTILLGLGTTVLGNLTGHPHDYRQTVSPWFRSIFYFHPDTALILQAPIGFRLHALSAWALFAFWPFSRLVHVFSAPLGYLTRPYIVYRSRDPQLGARPARQGWERVQ